MLFSQTRNENCVEIEAVFWIAILYSSERAQHFGGTYRLREQGGWLLVKYIVETSHLIPERKQEDFFVGFL
jgi:hypothetical protein